MENLSERERNFIKVSPKQNHCWEMLAFWANYPDTTCHILLTFTFLTNNFTQQKHHHFLSLKLYCLIALLSRSTTLDLIFLLDRLYREFVSQWRIKTVGGRCWLHAFDITVIARDAFVMTTTTVLVTTTSTLLTSVARTSVAHSSATSRVVCLQ